MPLSKLFHKRGSLKNKKEPNKCTPAKEIPKNDQALAPSGTNGEVSKTEVKILPQESKIDEVEVKTLLEENKVNETEVKVLPEENELNRTEVKALAEENKVNETEVKVLPEESKFTCVAEKTTYGVKLKPEETPFTISESSLCSVEQNTTMETGENIGTSESKRTIKHPIETEMVKNRQRSVSESKSDISLKVKRTDRKKSSSESETYNYQTNSEETVRERIIQLKERDLEEVIERYVNKLIQDSIVTAVKSVNVDTVCDEIWKNFSDRTYSESSDSIQNFVVEQRLASDSISEYIEELEVTESTKSSVELESENDTSQKFLPSEDEETEIKECESMDCEMEVKEIIYVPSDGYVADFEESLSIHSITSDSSYEKIDLQKTHDINKMPKAQSTKVDVPTISNEQLTVTDAPEISKEMLDVVPHTGVSNDQIIVAEISEASNEQPTVDDDNRVENHHLTVVNASEILDERVIADDATKASNEKELISVQSSEISNDRSTTVDATEISNDQLTDIGISAITHEQSPITDSRKDSNDELMTDEAISTLKEPFANDSSSPNDKIPLINATKDLNKAESELSSNGENDAGQDLTERTESECLNEKDSSLNESVKTNGTSQEGDSTDLIIMSPTEECPLPIPVGAVDSETSELAEDLGDNLPQQQHPVEEEKKINWKVGYLHVKLPHKSRGKGHLKVWKKRCVAIQPDEFVNDPNNPCLMISVYNAESGTSRKHSAVFWKAVSCKKAVVYRSNSSTHRYAFTISDDEKAVIHLAADSELGSQEWMAAIRSILWPPSPFMQLEKMLNGREFEISMIDNEFSYHAGLLGMYGYLTITPTKLILLHPQQGYVIQEWYLNTVDKFQLVPQTKIEDVHKVLAMTTCSDSSTGKGEILMFCTEAVALLQSLAATIHQVLTYHSKQEGGKYKKELEEIADWLVAPQPSKKEAPSEDYYKVPPRQVKSLLDIPNFIFQKSLTPVASAACTSAAAEPDLLQPSLETAKTNPTTASHDSGISAGNPVDEFLNCSVTSFVVGGGPFPGKSSDSELSEDTYTPPLSPEMKRKVFEEKKTEDAPVQQKLKS